MATVSKIIYEIDVFLERKGKGFTTPIEVNPWLEKKGVLNDSATRSGKPLRNLLRKGRIPHAYQEGNRWKIPHSGRLSNNEVSNSPVRERVSTIKGGSKIHKLEIVAELVVKLLEEKYGDKPVYILEYKPEWLLSYPTKELIDDFPEIKELYKKLVNEKYDLSRRLKLIAPTKLKQKQSFDIWIDKPFNFAIEFDESQHFNQYRAITLDYYSDIEVNYSLKDYKGYTNTKVKPNKSGFTKLSSVDPLFPELLEGERQDNRSRQRAFRDYLKDVIPVVNNHKPNLRIPYHITMKNINNFSSDDLERLEEYLAQRI